MAGCEPPVITDGSWHSQPGRPFFDFGVATMMLEPSRRRRVDLDREIINDAGTG